MACALREIAAMKAIKHGIIAIGLVLASACVSEASFEERVAAACRDAEFCNCENQIDELRAEAKRSGCEEELEQVVRCAEEHPFQCFTTSVYSIGCETEQQTLDVCTTTTPQCTMKLESDGSCVSSCGGYCTPSDGGMFCACPNDKGGHFPGAGCSPQLAAMMAPMCSN